MGGDEVGGDEPCAKRQVGALHHGPGDERRLGAAGLCISFPPAALARALEDPRARFEPPGLRGLAHGAHEPIRPPHLRQMLGAGVVVWEHRHKALDRRRFVVAPAHREETLGPTGNIPGRPENVIWARRLWLATRQEAVRTG